MASKNDITGDSIRSRHSDQKKYADNWEKIFGKKKQAQQDVPSAEDVQKQKDQAQDPRDG